MTMMQEKQKTARKIILVISSHVIRGAVGSRVNIFTFESFGYPVWSMLTVSMTWHPGQGEAHRLIVPEQDFTLWAEDILKASWRHEIDAVLTGYFAAPEQVGIAADLIAVLKKEKPELVFLCDPVMGDEGGLYVDELIAEAIRDRLLPLASIVKPNRNELEWICGQKFFANQDIIKAARSFSPVTMLVSSAFPLLEGSTGNLLVTEKAAWLAEHRRFTDPVSGLGDLTGSLFLAHRLDGLSWEKALQQATASVYEFLHYTLGIGADELALADAPLQLTHPRISVMMRRIPFRPV